MMYKSPGGAPRRPPSPLPGIRTREPVSTPAGMRILTFSVLVKVPLPLHSEHGGRPVPRAPPSAQSCAQLTPHPPRRTRAPAFLDGPRVSEIVGILAKAIIDGALLWIGKDIERFGHLLEAFFGGFVARIYVRVILACQPPVSFLDLFRLGIALDAENFVEVFLGHYFIADCQLPNAD